MRNYTTSFLFIFFFICSALQAQITLESADSFNGIAGGDDYCNDIITDDFGNIYSCGMSTDGISSYAILAKYNSSGQRLWLKTFREVDNGKDNFYSLAFDSDGNIYAAGNSWDSLTNNNFLIVKYDADGNLLWKNTYNGSQNNNDILTKILVDNSGNIYAAGSIMNGFGTDVTLLKYSNSGSLIWSRIYNGGNNLDDGADDIALDIMGNIYLCGFTSISTYASVSFVRKYNQNGDEVWSKISSNIQGEGQRAYGVVVDSSLNVYVAHKTNTNFAWFYLTEKLNSSGNLEWQRLYTYSEYFYITPHSIHIDENEDIYITGTGASPIVDGDYFEGYITVKYDSNGDSLWVAKYHRGYNAYEEKMGFCIYNSNNIFLAGYSYSYQNYLDMLLIKYDNNGDSVWVKTHNTLSKNTDILRAVACDQIGNPVVCGYSYEGSDGSNYQVLKYLNDGNYEWIDTYHSNDFSSENGGMVLEDSDGNYYATGSNRVQDILIKYNNLLNRSWVYTSEKSDTTYHSSTPLIAFDNDQKIYFVTHRKTTQTNVDIVITKLDATSSVLWTKIIATGTNNSDKASYIITDADGNLYLIGYGFNTGSGSKSFISKFSPDGQELWTKFSNDYYYYQKLLIKNNFLYASQDNYIEKYDLGGNLLWRKNYQPNNYVNFFRDFAVDSQGNIIATGTGVLPSQSENYITVKFNSIGDTLWTKRFNGIRSTTDEAYSIALDSLDNIYVSGAAAMFPDNGSASIVTIKYDPDGSEIWMKTLSAENPGSLPPGKIKLDEYDNVYVSSGYNYYGTPGYGYLITKYRSNGDSVWSSVYDNGRIRNFSTDFLISSQHDIIITGRAYGINTSYDLTTIRYSQLVGIQNISSNIPDRYELQQNYPNPFNPETKIRFSIPKENFVRIKVYDILGREVSSLVNKQMTPGTYEVSFDAASLSSGIYLYRIETAEFSDVKKMMVVK
jgi:uncharacterized delta-60 repeat protein